MGNTLKIDVNEKITIEDIGLGGKGNSRHAFAKFLHTHNYVDDGSFLLSAQKDKQEITLWKRIATFISEDK